MLDTNRFEEFISQYPIYEYRVLDAAEIQVRERVRTISTSRWYFSRRIRESPGPFKVLWTVDKISQDQWHLSHNQICHRQKSRKTGQNC